MAEEEKKYGVVEPNKGDNGMLASNTTGEDITPQYDYGNITESDKKVVDEIIGLLRARGDIPCSMFAEELKNKFQIPVIHLISHFDFDHISINNIISSIFLIVFNHHSILKTVCHL